MDGRAEKNGWFLAHQFETEANAAIHASTTFAIAMQVAEKVPAGSVASRERRRSPSSGAELRAILSNHHDT